MSQFRTTADICDEVLQKSGEPTNGNSPYESLVLNYLNKVHHAIIGGGNIFSLKVDEAWTWARAKYPIVLELEPSVTTGTVVVTANDVNITFSDAPAASIQGWHFQLIGQQTVYKVMEHTAAATAAQLDSSVVEDSGTYSFRAFKLDYELLPAYIYVDSRNDKIDFYEVANTPLVATLTHGSYTPTTFINHVVARLHAAGTAGLYTGSYDSVLKNYTITSSGAGGKILSLLGATGTNRRRSAIPLLGLDRLDHTGALTYSSAYIINGISRLIEPFKLFTSAISEPSHVTSTDPINMEIDYPMSMTPERIPDKFCRISEENDGTITVRFNAYPRTKTKLLLDWVPMPHDLQDNASSIPLIPRKDIDVLIHGASTFIQFDKEDTKWEQTLAMTKAALEAMEKKNRSELFRTGANFAQIVPRLDKSQDRKRLRYGYTVSGATASAAVASETTQTMITRTLTYANFQTGALTITVNARTLPANRSLFSLIVKHSIVFAGTGISALVLDVGISGDATKFVNGFDLMQAVTSSAQDSVLAVYYPAVATEIQVRVTATGANLSALTAGSVDIHFLESLVG